MQFPNTSKNVEVPGCKLHSTILFLLSFSIALILLLVDNNLSISLTLDIELFFRSRNNCKRNEHNRNVFQEELFVLPLARS